MFKDILDSIDKLKKKKKDANGRANSADPDQTALVCN